MTSVSYSHPEAPVRHSYPLHEKDDSLSVALRLSLKTLPYIILRGGILLGFTIGSIIWFGLTVTIALLTMENFGGLALLIAFGFPAGVYMWLRRYVLYMLKAGHIAVLTRLITHGELKDKENQVAYGKNIVTNNFAEVNTMFVLDALVDGVTSSFTRTLNFVSSYLPVPGISQLVDVLEKIVQRATTYIDECIFSYNLARGDDNKWRSAKDALIYYGQNWKPVLKTAFWSLVMEYAITAVLAILFLVPTGLFAWIFPSVGGWIFLFSFLFALNIKASVIHPVTLTMVMLTFHQEAHGQEINPTVDQTLSDTSEKFRELTEKSRQWIASHSGSGK